MRRAKRPHLAKSQSCQMAKAKTGRTGEAESRFLLVRGDWRPVPHHAGWAASYLAESISEPSFDLSPTLILTSQPLP